MCVFFFYTTVHLKKEQKKTNGALGGQRTRASLKSTTCWLPFLYNWFLKFLESQL